MCKHKKGNFQPVRRFQSVDDDDDDDDAAADVKLIVEDNNKLRKQAVAATRQLERKLAGDIVMLARR